MTNEELAIISIGASCQTAFQINKATPGNRVSSYFDWLICGTDATIKLLEAGIPHPRTIADITLNKGAPQGPSGELFWHYFKDDGPVDIERHGQATLAKLAHMADNTRRLASKSRILFVWSNTQNNLEAIAGKHGPDIMLNLDIAIAIMAACGAFARSPFHVLFVTQDGRWEPFDELPGSTVRVFDPYERSWHGDMRQWEPAVRDAVLRFHQVGIS